MRQLIRYWQDVQRYDDRGEPTNTERINLQVELDTESPSYSDQISTIEGYCGDDYTIEELPALPDTNAFIVGLMGGLGYDR